MYALQSLDLSGSREILMHGRARARRQFHENRASIVGVGATPKQIGLGYRPNPAQGSGRRNHTGDAQRTDGNPMLRNLRLQQVEQHILRWVGKDVFAEVARPKSPSADNRSNLFAIELRDLAELPLCDNRAVGAVWHGRQPREGSGDPSHLICHNLRVRPLWHRSGAKSGKNCVRNGAMRDLYECLDCVAGAIQATGS